MRHVLSILWCIVGAVFVSSAEGGYYSNRSKITELKAEYCPVFWESRTVTGEEVGAFLDDPLFDRKTGILHFSRMPCWGQIGQYEAGSLKYASVLAVAEILEFFPDYELYFVGESEFLYDFAQAVTEKSFERDPTSGRYDQNRTHFLPFSSELLQDRFFASYLIQEGINEKALKAGRKFLLVYLEEGRCAAEILEYLFSKKEIANAYELPLSRLYQYQFQTFSLNPNTGAIPRGLYSRAFRSHLQFKRGLSSETVSKLVALLPGFPTTLEPPVEIEQTLKSYFDPKGEDLDSETRELALARMRDIKKFVAETEESFFIPTRRAIRTARVSFLTGDFRSFYTALWDLNGKNGHLRVGIEIDLKEALTIQARTALESSFFRKWEGF